MWLALLIVLGLILCIVGLVTVNLAIIVPALALLGAGLWFHFGAMRQRGDKTGRIEKGPDQTSGATQPEDSPGGPTHSTRGPAHGGQGNMTP